MTFFEHRELFSRQVSCCYETQNCSRHCRLLLDHIVSQMAINIFDIAITDLCKKFPSSPLICVRVYDKKSVSLIHTDLASLVEHCSRFDQPANVKPSFSEC
jgi:hypothetical protein